MIEFTDPEEQLNKPVNFEKYKAAGKIAARVLDRLVQMCQIGVDVRDLCQQGDQWILEEVQKIYKKTSDKGIAFPTSISVDNTAGYNTQSRVLGDGSLAKIELGVHIDGFPALVAYTVLVGSINSDDPRAKIMHAINDAAKEVISLMKPGRTNKDVVNTMAKYATKYNCELPQENEGIHAPGVLSYQISQYVVDGYTNDDDEFIHRFILCKNNENYEYSMSVLDLEEDEVYAIDIVYSTGSGKLRRADADATLFRRWPNDFVSLKLKAAKHALGEFKDNPFVVNLDGMDGRTRMGLKECVSKGIVKRYDVIEEKPGEYVARVKFTVIVKNKPVLVVGRSHDEQVAKII